MDLVATPTDPNVTRALADAAAGEDGAAERLLPLVYDELRKLAMSMMARTPPGNTLQPTALVHEAYLRIGGDLDPEWDGRRHFFFAASRAMRDILVEQARRKSRLKHGGGRKREGDPDVVPIEIDDPVGDVLQLDRALRRLETEEPDVAHVVMLRYFSGLSTEETATVLSVSDRTVKRRWRYARVWLQDAMDADDADDRNDARKDADGG
ncbi:MAG: sigma-70 family RNA polymerase sigma factor [Phycisphaerales bacterium]|nr:sigma-70 family RNA polymerase sigma factor [Phycisphaerales bacterium]NNM24696.1 sigma-70 family RNA polymerase sigma factor [Phycisphaerales bacterium]